jgi:hypothetical protein
MTPAQLTTTARILKMRGMTQQAAWVAAQIKGE